MEAVGAGALENTSMVLKSVWVGSEEVGPRSVVVGGEEAESGWRVVERVRAEPRTLVVFRGWGERRFDRGECDENLLGRCGGFWRKGRVDWIASVARRARRRGMLGASMAVAWRNRIVFLNFEPICQLKQWLCS